MADSTDRVTLMTPDAMLAFHDLFTAKAIEAGKTPTFNATLLFSPEAQKTPEFAAMKAAAGKVAQTRFAEAIAKDPNFVSYLRSPFRQVDENEPKARQKKAKYYSDLGPGWVYINVSTKQRPGVVKPNGGGVLPIMDENEIYSGCFVRATISPYGYDQKGNQGVSFGLGNVMKVRDGERRGGRPTAENEFADFAKANPAAASKPAEDIFGASSLV
jgi:hypothetical protein